MPLAQFFQNIPESLLRFEYPCHLSDNFYFVNGEKVNIIQLEQLLMADFNFFINP